MTAQQDLMVLAYVVKGFWDSVQGHNIGVEPVREANGEMELMQGLIDFAKLDDALYAEVTTNGENTLVWCYDISEPFGNALAHHVHQNKEWPDKAHAKRMLQGIYEIATA